MFEIVIPSGEHRSLPQGTTTLGREESDLLLQDEQISRRHAQIHRQGNRLILQDLNSTNGTFVNGNPVTGTYQLKPGDQIRLGNTTLHIRSTKRAAPTQRATPDQLPVGLREQSAPHFTPGEPAPAGNDAPRWSEPAPPQQMVPVKEQPRYAQQPMYSHPPKQRSTAMLLEIGLGLFAFLGFGWIYSGNTSTGVTILIVDFLLNLFFAFLGAITFGISLIITVPIQITIVIVSASLLNKYTKQRTDLFGP